MVPVRERRGRLCARRSSVCGTAARAATAATIAVALSVALLLGVFVWSWVGMVRSAVRTLRDGQAHWGWKAVAMLALVLVAVFIVAAASDISTIWSQIE